MKGGRSERPSTMLMLSKSEEDAGACFHQEGRQIEVEEEFPRVHEVGERLVIDRFDFVPHLHLHPPVGVPHHLALQRLPLPVVPAVGEHHYILAHAKLLLDGPEVDVVWSVLVGPVAGDEFGRHDRVSGVLVAAEDPSETAIQAPHELHRVLEEHEAFGVPPVDLALLFLHDGGRGIIEHLLAPGLDNLRVSVVPSIVVQVITQAIEVLRVLETCESQNRLHLL